MAASANISYQSDLQKALFHAGANNCSIPDLIGGDIYFFTLLGEEPTCFTLAPKKEDGFIGVTVFDRSVLFISTTLVLLKNKYPELASTIDASSSLEFDDLTRLIQFSQKKAPFFFLFSSKGIFNLTKSANLDKSQEELDGMLKNVALTPFTGDTSVINDSIYSIETHSARKHSELEPCYLFVTAEKFVVDIRDLFYLLGQAQTLHVQHLIPVTDGTENKFEILFKYYSQLDAMTYLEKVFLNTDTITNLREELTQRKLFVLGFSSLKESTLNNLSIFSAYLESCGTGRAALILKAIETTKFYAYLDKVSERDPEEHEKITTLNILTLENEMGKQNLFSKKFRDGRVTNDLFIEYFNSLSDESQGGWKKTCINDDFMPVMRKIFGLLHLVRVTGETPQLRYDEEGYST